MRSYKQRLSALSWCLNNYADCGVSLGLSVCLPEGLVREAGLEQMGIAKYDFLERCYTFEADKAVALYNRLLGVECPGMCHLVEGRICHCAEPVHDHVYVDYYWVLPGFRPETVEILLEAVTEVGPGKYSIPVVFMAGQDVKILLQRTRALHLLVDRTMTHARLLGVPAMLPYPEAENAAGEKRRRRKDRFKDYRKVIKRLRDIAGEFKPVKTEKLPNYIDLYRETILAKLLEVFAYTSELLEKYGILEAASKQKWGPPKHFEETLKTLLVHWHVKGRFAKPVVRYVQSYRTGGPKRPDILVPVKRNSRIHVYIIDTKLWKTDVCRRLGTRKEPYEKYRRYRDSEPVKKLEQLLEKNEEKREIYYHLVFIQREEPTTECMEKLEPSNFGDYDSVAIYGLQGLLGKLVDE